MFGAFLLFGSLCLPHDKATQMHLPRSSGRSKRSKVRISALDAIKTDQHVFGGSGPHKLVTSTLHEAQGLGS